MRNATSVIPRPPGPAGADTAPPQATSETWAQTVRGHAMTQCSSLCHSEEPCSITADGVCDVLREFTIERAAIREYDGLQSRAEAEAGAIEDYQRWGQHERISTDDSK